MTRRHIEKPVPKLLPLSEVVRKSIKIAHERITEHGETAGCFRELIEWHGFYDWETVIRDHGIPVIDPSVEGGDDGFPEEIAEQLRGKVLRPGMTVRWQDADHVVIKLVDKKLLGAEAIPPHHKFGVVILSPAKFFRNDLPKK